MRKGSDKIPITFTRHAYSTPVNVVELAKAKKYFISVLQKNYIESMFNQLAKSVDSVEEKEEIKISLAEMSQKFKIEGCDYIEDQLTSTFVLPLDIVVITDEYTLESEEKTKENVFRFVCMEENCIEESSLIGGDRYFSSWLFSYADGKELDKIKMAHEYISTNCDS